MIHRNQRLTQDQQNKFQQICRDLGFAHLLDLEGGRVWKTCFLWYSTIWQEEGFIIQDKYNEGRLNFYTAIGKGLKYNFSRYDTEKRVQAAKALLILTESSTATLHGTNGRKAMLDGDMLATIREAALQHFLTRYGSIYLAADEDEAIEMLTANDFNDLNILKSVYEAEATRNDQSQMTATKALSAALHFTIGTLRRYGIFKTRDDGKPWPNTEEAAFLCSWLELIDVLEYGETEDKKGIGQAHLKLIKYILGKNN